MTKSEIKSTVREAGAHYVGIQNKFGQPYAVLFDDDKGYTFAVLIENCNIENIRKRMGSSLRKVLLDARKRTTSLYIPKTKLRGWVEYKKGLEIE